MRKTIYINISLMKNSNDYKNVKCVYKITCKVNNKILIGSTTNLYNRISHYIYDKNKSNALRHYNIYFYQDLIKYGIESFTIIIVEKFNSISDIELKNKETYYMNLYNSLDRTIGYNIRQDINGKYICSDSTKEIKRLQTSKQWADGIRDAHSVKMQNYWKNNESRKQQQSSIMSKNKTKFKYTVINKITKDIIQNNVDYKDLIVPNYTANQVLQKFCYVNKKANSKKENKSPFAIKILIDKIELDQYIISRTRI